MNKILITPRSLSANGHDALGALEEAGYELVTAKRGQMPTSDELKEILPQCVGWLAGVEPVTPDIIDVAQNLKVISRNGTGVDNLPLEYLAKRNIAVMKTPGANANGVAELALSMMLSAVRQIPQEDRGIKRGEWPRSKGREFSSLTVGIIGLGAIGTLLGQKCLGLGFKVLGYDIVENEQLADVSGFSHGSMSELVSQSDIISLHCPAPVDGTPVMGTVQLRQAKNGLIIVNTARAGLIDSKAMLQALDSGLDSIYATDVYEQEPPELDPLLKHENCIMTSHIGGLTDDSVTRATEMAVKNLLDVLGLK